MFNFMPINERGSKRNLPLILKMMTMMTKMMTLIRMHPKVVMMKEMEAIVTVAKEVMMMSMVLILGVIKIPRFAQQRKPMLQRRK